MIKPTEKESTYTPMGLGIKGTGSKISKYSLTSANLKGFMGKNSKGLVMKSGQMEPDTRASILRAKSTAEGLYTLPTVAGTRGNSCTMTFTGLGLTPGLIQETMKGVG
jgi:hypothetical protein